MLTPSWAIRLETPSIFFWIASAPPGVRLAQRSIHWGFIRSIAAL
jgi:hypothetical protein